ncbi:MAG: CpaF family protein, partial [Candidatus Bathyarchaeota archaeon]
MSLRARLAEIGTEPSILPDLARPLEMVDDSHFQQIKAAIHRKLLDRVDLEVMSSMPPQKLREEVRSLVDRLLVEEDVPLNAGERKQLVLD